MSSERGRSVRDGVRRLKNWVVLDGSRSAVAAGTVTLLLAFTTAVSLSRFSPLGDVRPLLYAYGSLISGNLTLITVVVSINQLLLSREMMTPDQLRSQIEGVVDFRGDIEESAGKVAPVEPLGFLRLVFQDTRQKAQRLGGSSRDGVDEDVAARIDDAVSDITRKIDRVDDLLDDRDDDPSTFQVLSTTLDTNYAREIEQLGRIDHRRGDRLPSHVSASIDDLVEHLQNIDIARQYLKSIYLQQELAALSQLLFYTGLPSVAVLAATIFLFTTSRGATPSRAVLSLLTPAVITVGLLPLSVLFAYILRTATVTRRTAAIAPFTTPPQE